MGINKYQVTRKLLLYSISALLLTTPVSSKAILNEDDIERQFNSSSYTLSNHVKIQNDLEAAKEHGRALKYSKGSKFTSKMGPIVSMVGTGLGVIGALDPEPQSKVILTAVGAGLNKAGELERGILSKALRHAAEKVEMRSVNKIGKVHPMDRIYREIYEHDITKAKLDKKYKEAEEETIWDKLLIFSSPSDRQKEISAKLVHNDLYLQSQADKDLEELANYVEDRSQYQQRVNDLEVTLQYLIKASVKDKDPKKYEQIIWYRTSELNRLKYLLSL
jgi:hypothetical protein